MFKVEVDNLEAYMNFDLVRRTDLQSLDMLIASTAPRLERYFHRGTPAGEPGMRFRMIGYGKYEYLARNGKPVEWPVVGIALQKNYISVYLSVSRGEEPLIEYYAGKLGELKVGSNYFSFEHYEDLNADKLAELFTEAQHIYTTNPRYSMRSS